MYSVREGWVVSKDNISEKIMGVDLSHQQKNKKKNLINWNEDPKAR